MEKSGVVDHSVTETTAQFSALALNSHTENELNCHTGRALNIHAKKLRLRFRKKYIEHIRDSISSTAFYVTKKMKTDIIDIIVVSYADNPGPVWDIIEALRVPRSNYMKKGLRDRIKQILHDTCKYWDTIISEPKPSNVQELLDVMVDGSELSAHFRDMFFSSLEVVMCSVRVSSNKLYLDVVGKLDADSFFERLQNEISALFGKNFCELRRSICYTGSSSEIEGNLETSYYSGSGTADLNKSGGIEIWQHGTMGGFAVVNEEIILITAGHNVCASREEYQPLVDEKKLSVMRDEKEDKDFAFLRISTNATEPKIRIMNHLYANVNGFGFQESDNFPFLDAGVLEPGTTIIKLGATTGLTSGSFVGKVAVKFTCKDITYNYAQAVLVQSKGPSLFSLNGDSGSIYYAVRGDFRYPIAVHIGTVAHVVETTLGKEKRQFSFGLCFFDSMMEVITLWGLGETTNDEVGCSDDPAGVTNDPAGCSDDPAGVTDDPAGVTNDPAGVTDDPAGVTNDPVGVTNDPVGVTDGEMGWTYDMYATASQNSDIGRTTNWWHVQRTVEWKDPT